MRLVSWNAAYNHALYRGLDRAEAEAYADSFFVLADEVVPEAECPRCHALVADLDGFGVLAHESCGYCSHPDVDGGICQACGLEPDEPPELEQR